MQDNLIIALKDRGMSEKEAIVYLTVLELGSAPASTIARHTEEKRTTVYALLKKLLGDGVVEEIKRKDVSYFSVVSPKLLMQYIEKKSEGFKGALPMLLELANTKGSKPKVTYLEGSIGIKKLFDDFALSVVDMRAILGTPKYFNDKLLKHVGVYRNARKKKKLKTFRILSNQNLDKKQLIAKDKEYNRVSKVIKRLPFDINADINIYGPNKISFLFFDTYNVPHILIIENESMYQSLYSLFEFIRHHAEKV